MAELGSAALARRARCVDVVSGLRWRGRLDATSRVRSLPPEPLSVSIPVPLCRPQAAGAGCSPSSYLPASRCRADDGRSQTLPREGKGREGSEGDSGFLVRNCCRSTHVSLRVCPLCACARAPVVCFCACGTEPGIRTCALGVYMARRKG